MSTFIYLLHFFSCLHLIQGQCLYGSTLSFARVSGFQPLTSSQTNFYVGPPDSAVTAECYNRCKQRTACAGYVVHYANSSCWMVSETEPSFVYAPDVSFFIKVCLPVPQNCTTRPWSVEMVPGYELVGKQHTIIPNVEDRWSCAGACLSQGYSRPGVVPCRSANYNSQSRTCTLSASDRWIKPDSFIPTTQPGTEYLENQCYPNLETEPCWREPVVDLASLRSDLQFFNFTIEHCRTRCSTERSFSCKAYSYLQERNECRLHADTLIFVHGPTLGPPLQQTPAASYIEVISCVDLTVTCSQESLNVTLESVKFIGRFFVQGHSEECGVQGRGSNVTQLIVMLPTGDDNPCDLSVAHAIGTVNRTMVTTVVVIQYHQLIQTVNDRIIKVNCLITESSFPLPNNYTINATFSIPEPGVQSEVSGVGGNVLHNGTLAKATMSLIDLRTGSEATDVQLGDPLQLRITIETPFNVSMVRAGHLVATSGSQRDSLLLLDWRGCPPDVTTFPGLTPLNNNVLAADFRAFRFPSSPVLMLSIVLTICPTLCQPSDCGNGIISYGRKRRTTEEDRYEEMPLQLAFIVRGPAIKSDNYSDAILSASFGYDTSRGHVTGDVCASFLVLALIILFWFLLQVVIFAFCCCLLQKKKDTEMDKISLRHDFHPRHVTWAQDSEIPSKSLRLSTPVNS